MAGSVIVGMVGLEMMVVDDRWWPRERILSHTTSHPTIIPEPSRAKDVGE